MTAPFTHLRGPNEDEDAGMRLLIDTTADLHRLALPAAHAPRLPAHLLRRMPEGMVRLPSVYRYIDTPVYLPFVSRLGTNDAAKRLCHHPARQLREVES
jgi:hypothetical protein